VEAVARGGDFREALWQFRGLLMMPLVVQYLEAYLNY
jgi:hypothetical protein